MNKTDEWDAYIVPLGCNGQDGVECPHCQHSKQNKGKAMAITGATIQANGWLMKAELFCHDRNKVLHKLKYPKKWKKELDKYIAFITKKHLFK
jgi:hypothetical protein